MGRGGGVMGRGGEEVQKEGLQEWGGGEYRGESGGKQGEGNSMEIDMGGNIRCTLG